jgi:hypothetical protein
MSDAINSDPTLAVLQEDLAALKRDVSSLIAHLKTGAASGAQSAADQLDGGARRLYDNVSAEGCKSVKALGRQIEEQPVLALLVVLGLGYVAGRLLTR